MSSLYEDGQKIIWAALQAAMPDTAVKKALADMKTERGRLILVAVGKAAWQMAAAASAELGDRIDEGIVITKYGHVKGELRNITCYEAGHPVPDKNSFFATEAALKITENLNAEDQVLFLLSGGGSALFEKPLLPSEELEQITNQLLASGAGIMEINTVRKRLSAVKGGRFALHCRPANVFAILLSDIIGDPLDMIASGPAYPDGTTCAQAQDVIRRYHISVSEEAAALLKRETPKKLDNVMTRVTGSVRQLCKAAADTCEALGYKPVVLTAELCCQAREAGSFLGTIGKFHSEDEISSAYIAGGETVVKLTGKGKGGRNQELALAAAPHIAGLENVALFSIGSDGTDGPTEAAGGYVDGSSRQKIEEEGRRIEEILADNDAYHGLKSCGGLLITGPTGTNVNDIAVVLIQGRRKSHVSGS